jgi:hypothetical protein
LIGWIAVLAALFGLGLLVELGAKRLYHQLLDRLFRRVPVIGSLYGSLKQLVGMFDRKEETELKAMSVVFCYFGSRQGPGVLALMPSPSPCRSMAKTTTSSSFRPRRFPSEADCCSFPWNKSSPSPCRSTTSSASTCRWESPPPSSWADKQNRWKIRLQLDSLPISD